ncbi:LysR family transcriptional regulator [Archangium primigenium]|uniref:LysR family transcriptional regulator n=1 Tax=[Archangium] primigenium TaxID=2792470 RepID=UPI0019565D54|nr:LysR family transcriptional regulator [Archangium primigenium]MBM7116438.1 LysR family transcriptional regulator [Archangium primigenium]
MSFTPLHGLHAFAVVARHRGFSAAARELGVSPSALSQSVRQLEERLGVVLLSRTTRSVAPTEVGARLLERSGVPLERALEGLRTVVHEAGELTGTVRLSVPEFVTEHVLAPLVARFLEAHPRVTLEIDVDSRRVDLVREGYDAGVRMENIPKDMIRSRLGAPFRLLVVGAPSYLARHGEPLKPEDLLRHRCLGMRAASGQAHPWELERGRRVWKVPVKPVLLCDERRARLAMVEAGVGLGYVAEPEVEQHLARGTLRPVLEAYAARVPGLFLYYPSRRQASPAFRAFVESVQRHRRP